MKLGFFGFFEVLIVFSNCCDFFQARFDSKENEIRIASDKKY